MNWADYVILSVFVVSIVIGLVRGITREVLGVAGWVLAFWVAFTFTHQASEWLSTRIDTPSVRRAAAFGGLFLSALMVGSVATFFLSRSIRDSRFSSIDRTLGAGFGVLRGLVLIAALLLGAGSTAARQDPWWHQSTLIPHLEWMADALRTVVPDHWIRELESSSSSSSGSSNGSSSRKATPTK